ncbi:kelch-like protein 21 isoform X2 [Mytilus edulis]
MDFQAYPRNMGNKSSHALKLQQHLYDQMSSQTEFCDVTLMVGDIEVKAHWNVLVSCPYFQSLYDSGMDEKVSGKVILHIGKLAAIRSAIAFLYVGTVEISYENVRDLLEVAEYFQISDLKQACRDYLFSVEVTVDNCVQICLLCSQYDLDIYNKTYDFLRGHLPEVMKKDDILTLTHDSILAFIMDQTLSYIPQEEFFNFIIRWVKHDEANRLHCFSELFCALDLIQMSKQVIETILEKNNLVSRQEDCKAHILRAKLSKDLTYQETGQRDVILVAGGCSHSVYVNNFFHHFSSIINSIAVSNIYGYVIQDQRWTEIAPLPHQMRRPLLTYDNSGHLYVFDTEHTHDSTMFYIYKFRISDKSWTSFKINVPEAYLNASLQKIVACNNKLYAVISSQQAALLEVKEDGNESEIKCQLFHSNPSTQVNVHVTNNSHICVLAWKHGIKVKKSRHYAKFIVYDVRSQRRFDHSKGSIFETHMFSIGNDITVCRMGKFHARKFNLNDRRWKPIADQVLPFPPEDPARTDFASISDGNNFFLFGGKDQSTKKPLETAYKYTYRTKSWTKLEDMPQALMQSAICIAKFPVTDVRCHIKCPHCLYHSRRSQALYNVEYPPDEDECTDYSNDDDYLSDHWVDYYDDYEAFDDPFEHYWY